MAKTLDQWADIRRRLEAERRRLNAEIAAYPAPIPACDAQFNHLLEQRAAIADAIGRFDAARGSGLDAGDRSALESFIADCPFLAQPHPGAGAR